MSIESVTAIMSDMRNTNDWFYSFRWLKAQYYQRLRRFQSHMNKREIAYYSAHKQLNPVYDEGLISLTPMEYKRKFAELNSDDVNGRISYQSPKQALSKANIKDMFNNLKDNK